MFRGIGASDGIGIGKIIKIEDKEIKIPEKQITDVNAECQRFLDAVDVFVEKTMNMAEDMRKRVGEKEAEILEGHAIMMQDPSIIDGVKEGIENGTCAEKAFVNVCDMFVNIFSMSDDELTKQRITDICDMQGRMLKILLGIEEVDITNVPANTILAAVDLTPSMTVGINKENVVGIITEVGGRTSHSAILARALGIPAVLSIKDVMSKIENGKEVVVDGSEGIAILNPAEEVKTEYSKKRESYYKEKEALKQFIGKETETADGHKVELVCNIGKPSDVDNVISFDGEGVGLFRTEFLFMDRNNAPSEEEQFESYKSVCEKLSGKPVIIRTLDVGGDKEIPYLELEKEENPFLGYRAIRVCLDRKEMYRLQLRALLRASAFGNIKIMVPMVTCIEELREVKHMIEELKAELSEQGIAYDKDIKVGVMIETSVAVLIADILAKEADFFSIGTNDLTQYTMVVDRGNAKVAYLYSTYNPAVLRAIKYVIKSAKKENIMVGMCGEAAADELLIPLLLAYGLDEFSVSATSVLSTRKTISMWSKEEADVLLDKVEQLVIEEEVKNCLKANIK